jgi:RES domain-containing protein
MIVHRISLSTYAQLKPSGIPGRWNSKGKFVIYTAESTALACLENIVHRSSHGLNSLFKVLIIELPDGLGCQTVDLSKLSNDWNSLDYTTCQKYGDEWIESFSSLTLKAPSVIIPGAYNYLLNCGHPDFKKIKLLEVKDFVFDTRIKAND